MDLDQEIEKALDVIVGKTKKYHHFCKKFKLNGVSYNFELRDEVEEQQFNENWNSTPEKQKVMLNDMTELLKEIVQRRIARNRNIVIKITGPTGLGKSEVGFWINFYWKNEFHLQKKIWIVVRISFSNSQLTSDIEQMKFGDISMRDESPLDEGEGAYNINKNIGNVIEIVRQDQNSFILINPTEKKIKVEYYDYKLMVAGIDYGKKQSRCILYNNKGKALGIVRIPLHPFEKERKEYSERKTNFVKMTKLLQGVMTVDRDADKINSEALKLVKFVLSLGKKEMSKPSIKLYRRYYNKQFDIEKEKNKMILGDNAWIASVVDATYDLLHGDEDLLHYISNSDKEITLKEQLDFLIKKNKNKSVLKSQQQVILLKKPKESFPDFVKRYFEKKIEFEGQDLKRKELLNKYKIVGICLSKGMGYREIENLYLENVLTTHEIRNEIGPGLRNESDVDIGLGYILEYWIAIYYEGITEDTVFNCIAGNTHGVDIYNAEKDKASTVKWRFGSKRAKKISFNMIKDFAPEYKWALENEKPFGAYYYESAWNPPLRYINEIDPNKQNPLVEFYRDVKDVPKKLVI